MKTNLVLQDEFSDQTTKKTWEIQNLQQEYEKLYHYNRVLEEKLLFYEKEYQIKTSSLDKDQINRKDNIDSLMIKCEKLQQQLNSVLESYAIQGDQLSALEKRNLKLEHEYTRYTEIITILNQQKNEIQMMFLKLKDRCENKKRKFKLINEELKEARNKMKLFENNINKETFFSQQDLPINDPVEILKQELEIFVIKLEQLTHLDQLNFNFQSPLAKRIADIFRKFIQKFIRKQEQKRKWKNLYKENLMALDKNKQGQFIRIRQQEKPKQMVRIQNSRLDSASKSSQNQAGNSKNQMISLSRLLGIKKMLAQFVEEYIHQNEYIKETDKEIGLLNKDNPNDYYGQGSKKLLKILKSYSIIIISIKRMQKKYYGEGRRKLKKLKITLPVLKNLNPLLNLIGVLSQKAINKDKFKQKGCSQCTKQNDQLEMDQIKQMVARELQQEINQFSMELNIYKETIKQNQQQFETELSEKSNELFMLNQINKKQTEKINELCAQINQLINENSRLQTLLKSDDQRKQYENLLLAEKLKVEEIERKFMDLKNDINQIKQLE